MANIERLRTTELHADTTTAENQYSGDVPHLRVPGLVIVAHPDPARVGETAPLPQLASGRSISLSRLEPLFADPADPDAEPQPLADAHLSRAPLLLKPGADTGSIVLENAGSRTEVLVGGEKVEGGVSFGAAQVERGVVFVLSRRVALLLYPVDPLPPEVPHFGLVGESAELVRVRREIEIAAELDVPVLLRGETGTGKELVGRAIHSAGNRRERPYVAVNMGALVPSLAASELFGASRGAYTGAERRKAGYFEGADGGTLFLDEIGEVPAEVQVLLLRALENREIHPVGSVEKRPVDVRVVAATDTDLGAAIEAGRFRSALFHRLAGFEIRIPALDERRDDVARLLLHFLEEELGGLEAAGSGVRPWPPAELVARLVEASWPGNVRQLRNAARRLGIARRTRRSGALDSLVDELLTEPTTSPSPESETTRGTDPPAPPRKRRGVEVGADELAEALEAHRWQLQPAAEALGISRATLYRLVENDPRFRKATDLDEDEIRSALGRNGGDADAAAAKLEVSPQGLKRRITALGLDD